MGDFLVYLSSSLETVLNIIEFLALIISIITFFFLMLNQYAKTLKAILGPCGLGFRHRIRVLFICRKSAVKKRAFIEYAMLKTQGHGTISSSWNIIINEFKSFYYAEQVDLTYSIPNCTVLIGADFSDAVARYFKHLKRPRVRKAFGIQDDTLKWVIKIHIEETYATPTCLLNGLLSKYEENWEEFIKRYVSTAYITESDDGFTDSILSNELYLTFAWLLWGPSYELSYRRYWAGLCQLSYGDESNSIPAVANKDSDVIELLKSKFEDNKDRRYGALLSTDISLHEKKAYYRKVRDDVNPDNSYFYDKIENDEIAFAAQIDGFTSCMNYKSKKYYCTAYVWLLFEVDNDDFGFKPEKSVAFFEHANLTDKHTYNFLIGTLIEKSLAHFKMIFENPNLSGRRYRFVCAFNEKIANACKERFTEVTNQNDEFGLAVKDRISFEPKHSAVSAFATYDRFFSRNNSIVFDKVDEKHKESITNFGVFYTNIYMECFPDPDERETFDSILSYLSAGTKSQEYKYHIELAHDENGCIIGGCIFDYFKKSNSGVIEFLAVKRDLQSGGIGTEIYKHALAVLEEDAYNATKSPLKYVFCEIDSPEYSSASIKKYLHFWHKNGYKHLDFKYIQPPLSPTKSPVYGLWFTVMPFGIHKDTVNGDVLKNVIGDYMKYCMRIDDYESNAEYRKMKAEIEEKTYIKLLNII